jgi:hypothetical protein
VRFWAVNPERDFRLMCDIIGRRFLARQTFHVSYCAENRYTVSV